MEQAPQQIIDWIRYYSQGLPNQFLIGNIINSAYLPSYVDDVVEFNDFASLPINGETSKIYVTTSDNKQYRWSGSAYISIGGANAGGANTQIQFNNSGNFSGVSEFSWDNTGKLLNVNGLKIGLGPGNIATNLLIGSNSFIANTTGYNNIIFGAGSMLANTTGYYNIVVGANSLFKNTTGYRNIAIGAECLRENLTAKSLTAIGFNCLPNVTAEKNTAIGAGSAWSITTGGYNTCIGSEAGWNISTGAFNIAIGYQCLDGGGANSTASYNVAIGTQALYSHTTGGNNTALGYRAGFGVVTASSNVFIGNNTGQGITSGNYNTIIGANVSGLPATLNNTIIIADGQNNKRIVVFQNGNVAIGAETTIPVDNGDSLQVLGNGIISCSVLNCNSINFSGGILTTNSLETNNLVTIKNTQNYQNGEQLLTLEDNGLPIGIGFQSGCSGADLELFSLPKTLYYVADGNGTTINERGFWYFDEEPSVNQWRKI